VRPPVAGMRDEVVAPARWRLDRCGIDHQLVEPWARIT
jgi:hypothetical protein